MKTLRFSIIILVTMFFVAGLCSIAAAASPRRTPVRQMQKAPVMKAPTLAANPCPAGWHKVAAGGNGDFKCKPNKPKPVNCPPGTSWEDRSQTSCEVGCYYYVK